MAAPSIVPLLKMSVGRVTLLLTISVPPCTSTVPLSGNVVAPAMVTMSRVDGELRARIEIDGAAERGVRGIERAGLDFDRAGAVEGDVGERGQRGAARSCAACRCW